MTDIDFINTQGEEKQAHILPIITWPDERLNTQCKNIGAFDEWLKQFAIDLFATMKYNNGIGLAAPQVGVLVNVISLWLEKENPQLLVNPEILQTSEKMFEFEEGCLSVPGYFSKQERPASVLVKYQDVGGNFHETEFHGVYAFAVQHEIDHLNGKVFVDDLSPMKKRRAMDKVKKQTKRLK